MNNILLVGLLLLLLFSKLSWNISAFHSPLVMMPSCVAVDEPPWDFRTLNDVDNGFDTITLTSFGTKMYCIGFIRELKNDFLSCDDPNDDDDESKLAWCGDAVTISTFGKCSAGIPASLFSPKTALNLGSLLSGVQFLGW